MKLVFESDKKTQAETIPLSLDDRSSFPRDVAERLIEEYADLVQSLTARNAPPLMLERAYVRVLGVRGSLCRICPTEKMALLHRRSLNRWESAEQHLYQFFFDVAGNEKLLSVIQSSEAAWITSAERYVHVMSTNMVGASLPDQIGLLRGIDSIALHLAQRELFHWSFRHGVPPDNAASVKLRIRLLSLFLATDRLRFNGSYRAIQSYRETFGIFDRLAYPWWFVDCDLTERQINWTYRRLGNETLGWRF